MRNLFTIASLSALALLASCGGTQQKHEVALDTREDSLSYALGVSIGQNLKEQGFENVDPDAFAKGMREQADGSAIMDPLASDEYIQGEMDRIAAIEKEQAQAEGIAFLEENKTKEGVITSPSGLQYKVVVEGDGPSPVGTDEVTVHYHGTLIDGTVFDSSVDRGQPATFGLNRVIRGWTEGLQTMKTGGKTIFYIPSELAYGPRATGKIKPYSTLIFEVELISITGKE